MYFSLFCNWVSVLFWLLDISHRPLIIRPSALLHDQEDPERLVGAPRTSVIDGKPRLGHAPSSD